MSDIQAIETNYAGCRFRSRLEARYAVFFDSLGIEWQYEPQGFKHNKVQYLPDFYLPETETWVEVKGASEMFDEARMEKFFSKGCPLPGFDSPADPTGMTCRGLLLLGPIPDATDKLVLHQLLHWEHSTLDKDRAYISSKWAWFTDLQSHYIRLYSTRLFGDIEHDFLRQMFCIAILSPDHWQAEPLLVHAPHTHRAVVEAYAAARAARFEFGECG